MGRGDWQATSGPKELDIIERLNTYTQEYYSVMKKNEIMPFAGTWMDLEIIILSDRSQRKPNIMSLICAI